LSQKISRNSSKWQLDSKLDSTKFETRYYYRSKKSQASHLASCVSRMWVWWSLLVVFTR